MNKIIYLNENNIIDLLYEAISIDDRYNKFYSDIPRNIFDNLVSIDPTPKGFYIKKIIELYKNGQITASNFDEFKMLLKDFHNYNKNKQIDFNTINNIQDLRKAVETLYTNYMSSNSKELEKKYKIAYEDDKWVIIIPLTYEASRYWGYKKFKTSWCTAGGENGYNNGRKMFNSYCLPDENGIATKFLYINYDKENKLAYQFSFSPNEFRDSDDNEVGISSINMSNGAMEYYIENNLISNIMTSSMVQNICDEINNDELDIKEVFIYQKPITNNISAFYSKKYKCYVFLAIGDFMSRKMLAPIKIGNSYTCSTLDIFGENCLFITFDDDEDIGTLLFLNKKGNKISTIAKQVYQPEPIDERQTIFFAENESGVKFIYDVITNSFISNYEKDEEIVDYDIYDNILVLEYGEKDYVIYNIIKHQYYSNQVTAWTLSNEFEDMIEYETYYNDGDKFIYIDDENMNIHYYDELSDEDDYYYESYKNISKKILKEFKDEQDCQYPKLMEIKYKAKLIYDEDNDLDNIEIFIYSFETPDNFMFDFNSNVHEEDLEYYFGTKNAEKIMDNITNGTIVNEYENEDGYHIKELDCSLQLINMKDFTNNDINKVIEISKKIFGTTNNYKIGLFLLPDGEILNGSQNGINRTIDHHQLESYMKTPLSNIVDLGFIRLQPQSPGFEIHKLPTPQQEYVLKDYVRKLGSANFYVDYGNNISAIYYDPNPNVVIADIYRYFVDGIKPLR